jgi:acetyl esterase/lipase
VTGSWTNQAVSGLAFTFVLFLWPAPVGAEAHQFGKKTYTYKMADKLPIQADVYRAGDAKVRPVLVWIHGGALIVGNRHGVPRNLVDLCRQEGYVLVSLDYRLAPEVKLPAIIADLKDALSWVRVKGPGLFHADPDRIVVAGGSAGGYLTMMTGICVEPARLLALRPSGSIRCRPVALQNRSHNKRRIEPLCAACQQKP